MRKHNVNINLMFVFVTLLCPLMLYSQTALQEMTRFNVPFGNYFYGNISGNGDVNGDGVNDVIFGCGEESSVMTCDPYFYIYHGIPDSNSVPAQIIVRPDLYDTGGFGYYLSYSGDINGDGCDDIIIGANYTGLNHTGTVYIYFGGETISENPDIVLNGENYAIGDNWYLYFGERIISDCDLNGDGYDDIIIYGGGPNPEAQGNVFVFLGGAQISTTCALHLFGTNDNEELGRQMATGDINGDGYDDIVLTRRIPNGTPDSYNKVLQIYAGGVTLSNNPVYENIVGNSVSGGPGGTILANGDLNGDGFDDITMMFILATDFSIKVIYGHNVFDSLTVQQAAFPASTSVKNLLFYCNFDNDVFSDLAMWQKNQGEWRGYFTGYKQTSEDMDLNYDFINAGDELQSNYGRGYLLGDINQDGHQDFFVYSIGNSINYATILTEQYTGVEDEITPIPDTRLLCYPNPFNNLINIKLPDHKKFKPFKISVYDVKGRKVYAKDNLRTDTFSWNPITDCETPLSSGIYFLRVEDNSKSKTTSKIIYTK